MLCYDDQEPLGKAPLGFHLTTVARTTYDGSLRGTEMLRLESSLKPLATHTEL